MRDEAERRLASNEDVFREVNESIESGRWPGDEQAPVAFRCECARLGCDMMIELPIREYERVRANPRRFIVAVDHDNPELETVVEAREDYLVVEKLGEAGRVSEDTDPRG